MLPDSHRLYAGQFALGIPQHSALTKTTVFGGTPLALHASLDFHRSEAAAEMVCIGTLLDPFEPQRLQPAIVDALATLESFDAFEKAAATLNGRWVIFIRIGSESRIYHDACGLKSVFYWGSVVVSQPGLLVDAFGLEVDATLVESLARDKHDADSWPGEITPFAGVKQLLPNHYLDLKTGIAHRFWPKNTVAPVEPKEAAARCATILHGTIAATHVRGSLALPLTAGYDSRTLFACAKGLRSDIKPFRILGHHLPWYDTGIPRRLAKRYGLRVHEIKPVPCSSDDWATMQRNIAGMWWDPTEYMTSAFGKTGAQYVLFGWVAEIGRCFYYPDGQHPQFVTPESLAHAAKYHDNPHAIESFRRWLESVPQGINVMDLFYWEHRVGNWASMMGTAYEMFVKPIAPYNCRALLETMLGVDISHRRAPNYELHRAIIDASAPELLAIPFNFSIRDLIAQKIANASPWRLRVAVQRWRARRAGFV